MARQRKLEILITDEHRGSGFKDADKQAKGFGDTVGRLGKTIGASLVLDQVVDWGVGFVRAAEESAQVAAQTDAVIKSMGGAAGVTSEHVADLSEKLSAQAGIDDELIQSGQNVLLTFGNIQNRVGEGNDIFDQAATAALDMSVALGTDLNTAAIQVGKALNDPIRGMTALSRAGVSFTEQQRDQIRTMVESGDVLGAQKVLLSELDKQFGGSAEAQATATGKMAVAWGNLQEQLGARLLPIVTVVADAFSSLLSGPFGEVAVAIGTVGAGFAAAAYLIGQIVGPVRSAMKSFSDMAASLGTMGSLLGPAGVVAGLGLLGFALYKLGNAQHDQEIDKIAQSIANLGGTIRQEAFEDLQKLSDGAETILEVFDSILEQSPAVAEAFIESAVAAGVDSEAVETMRQRLADTIDTTAQVRAMQNEYNAELAEAGQMYATATEAAQAYMDTLRAQFDPLFGMLDALRGNRDALAAVDEKQRALNDAIAQHGVDSLEAMAASDQLTQAHQAATQTALGLTGAASALSAAVEDGTVSVADARAQMAVWVSQGLITQATADAMASQFDSAAGAADRLGRTDPNVFVSETGAGATAGALYGVAAAVGSIDRNVTIQVTALAGAAMGVLAGLPHRAAGGPVRAGEAYLVGEKGPEIAFFGENGTVIPNDELGDLEMTGGGGGIGRGGDTYHLYFDMRGVVGLDERSMERVVVRAVNRAQGKGVTIKVRR